MSFSCTRRPATHRKVDEQQHSTIESSKQVMKRLKSNKNHHPTQIQDTHTCSCGINSGVSLATTTTNAPTHNAFVVSSFPSTSSPVISNIIIGAAAAAAGLLLGQLSSIAPSSAACERCEGRGFIDCTFCSHWNYSSVKGEGDKKQQPRPRCSSCRGSLRTRCPNCGGGGGISVPVLSKSRIPVRIDDGYNSIRRFSRVQLSRYRHRSAIIRHAFHAAR